MATPFYTINQSRIFSADKKFADIDWSNLNEILDATEVRLHFWYLDPAEKLKETTGHLAFGAMTLTFVLIDTLSHFWNGKEKAGKEDFKRFVRASIPEFAATLPGGVTIRHADASQPGGFRPLSDYAEVLYHGFRCGVLHEAHVTPYGKIDGETGLIEWTATGQCYYSNGSDCPLVTINPWILLERVGKVVEEYFKKLRSRSDVALLSNFKEVFRLKFGINIDSAT